MASLHYLLFLFLLLLFSILCYFFMTSIKYFFISDIENHPLLPLQFLSETLATWPCLQYILATVILLLHFVLHFYNFNLHTIIHCLMNIKEKCLYKMPLASGMPFGDPSSHLSLWCPSSNQLLSTITWKSRLIQKSCTKKPILFLASMGETELSKDIIFF